jgi:hypothetical protein
MATVGQPLESCNSVNGLAACCVITIVMLLERHCWLNPRPNCGRSPRGGHFALVTSSEIHEPTSIKSQFTNHLRGRLTNFTIRVRTSMKWIKRHWYWLKWSVALLILGYLFFQNRDGFAHLAEQSLDGSSFAVALVLATANVLLTFYRWYLLVRAQRFPFRLRDAFRIGFLGYVFNLVGAGATGGDVVKAVLIAKEQDSRRAVAVATILLDRVIGLLSLLMVGAMAAFFQLDLIERSAELKMLAGFLWGGSLFGLLGLFLLLHPAIPHWRMLKRLVRLPIIGSHIDELICGVVLYQQSRRVLAGAVAIGLLAHVCGLSAFYFCSQALQLGPATPTLSAHLLLIPAAVIVEIVVPLPGGIGALEAAVQHCYVLANAAAFADVPTTQAAEAGFLTALLFRVLTLIIAALGWVYYIAARKELKSSKQQQSLPSHDRKDSENDSL